MMNLMSVELTDKQFRKISSFVYEVCGINLKEGKEALVRARLMKRLRALGMNSFEEYFKLLERDEQELDRMVDVMTTNKTSFFRETEHFKFLQENVLPYIKKNKMRFWTAACSSGEEPFTLGIVLKENLSDIHHRDVKILATDISIRMLEKARESVYGIDAIRDVPPYLLQKYFTLLKTKPRKYAVKDIVRKMVHFARLNLMDPWPMRGPFDVVFCRNVMIYFDRPTQQKLINRFWDLLEPGGFLFVGHSEGLSAINHNFRYIKPAIYRKQN